MTETEAVNMESMTGTYDDILLEKIERITELERMVRETSLENERLRVRNSELMKFVEYVSPSWLPVGVRDVRRELLAENTRLISAESGKK